MCAQIHTSKFHFRFAFVFPFTLCFPFRVVAKAQIQSALCQVLSGLFFEFLARTRHQHCSPFLPHIFSTIPYQHSHLPPSLSPWRDFCVCLMSVRVPKMSFGRANKLNSIFCRRAKLLKTRLLPSCGNSYYPLHTPTHTHSYRSHVRATWSYYMVYLNSIYASLSAPNLQLCLMTSCA